MPSLRCLLDRHSGVPIYRQIVDQVRFQAAAGALKPGDELPSTRTLSSELGVTAMTISRAYAELERLGVIKRRRGLASVVAALPEAARVAAEADELRRILKSAASAIRQLGAAKSDALRALEELLDGDEGRTP